MSIFRCQTCPAVRRTVRRVGVKHERSLRVLRSKGDGTNIGKKDTRFRYTNTNDASMYFRRPEKRLRRQPEANLCPNSEKWKIMNTHLTRPLIFTLCACGHASIDDFGSCLHRRIRILRLSHANSNTDDRKRWQPTPYRGRLTG